MDCDGRSGKAWGGTLAEESRRLKRPGGGLPPVILIADRLRAPDPAAQIAALPDGAAVLLRDYDAPDRRARAIALRAATRARGLRLLIAADWRLAWQVGADGLHLPEWLARSGCRFDRIEPGWLITAAAHDRAGLIAAARAGAAAALLSPVFPTRSHPGARTLGPVRFAALAKAAPLPVYALGGMDGHKARRIRKAGAAGIAGISGFAPPKGQ